jgi:hypothetical protein
VLLGLMSGVGFGCTAFHPLFLGFSLGSLDGWELTEPQTCPNESINIDS